MTIVFSFSSRRRRRRGCSGTWLEGCTAPFSNVGGGGGVILRRVPQPSLRLSLAPTPSSPARTASSDTRGGAPKTFDLDQSDGTLLMMFSMRNVSGVNWIHGCGAHLREGVVAGGQIMDVSREEMLVAGLLHTKIRRVFGDVVCCRSVAHSRTSECVGCRWVSGMSFFFSFSDQGVTILLRTRLCPKQTHNLSTSVKTPQNTSQPQAEPCKHLKTH